MDREIDPGTRRATQLRRIAFPVVALGGGALLLLGVTSVLRPSVTRDQIRTARADRGPIDATITAAGTVVPELEEIVSSPIDARVLRILARPGTRLAAGEPILELEMGEPLLALSKLDQSLLQKENQAARARLDLQSALSSLESQVAIKRLQLDTYKASVSRNRTLFSQGLLSQEQLRQSELDEGRATLELAQLEDSRKVLERQNALQIEGLELERKTLLSERAESRKQLELATTKASRPGVLTYVVNEVGGRVHKGDVIARVADLTSFRVDATLSDVNATRVAPGMAARVDVNGLALSGTVSRVLPTIQNGVMTVAIALDEPSSPSLKSQLRVDVALVTERKPDAVRLAKGPFATIDGQTCVFVVRSGRLVRTNVKLGVASPDRYEVLSGLAPGDEVVVSDMSSLFHMTEVRIR